MININHFIKGNGKSNSMRARESYVKNIDINLYNNIINHVIDNNIIVYKFSESMYYYFNNIKHQIVCNNIDCNNVPRFISLSSGYLTYCSSKCSNASIDVKNKKIESTRSNYGVDNPFQSTEIKEKLAKTMVMRYGSNNPMRCDNIKSKMINRSIDNNGTKWALSKGGTAYKSRILAERIKYDNIISENISILKWNESKNGICKFRCNICDGEFESTKYLIYQRSNSNVEQCLICNPIGSFNSTSQQLELVDFISNMNINVIEHDRKLLNGKELDIFIP